MNRKQKIIVSIVGIIIVLLALLGITYAYYLTRIQGNTNTNSISITTADLKVEYRDGNGIISAENIMPGTMVTGTDGKTFTVENSGTTKVDAYSVALDYAYLTLEDGTVVTPSVFVRPWDFKITLTCTSNIEGKTCNGYSGEFNNSNITMRTNSIDAGEIHSYKLEIYYDNPDEDQSKDMGKVLNLKVQIYGVTGTADITGSITGVDETNSVRLESDPKVSTITKEGENYYYKFTGVEPGTHTLTIIDENGEELKNANGEVVSQKIVVATGTSSGIGTTSIQDGSSTVTVPKITVTEVKRVVNLSTKVDTSSETSIDINNTASSIETFNPYAGDKNTLAYYIINNSINKINGTEFSYKPITTPGVETSKYAYTGKYKESTIRQSYTSLELEALLQEYTLTYADTSENSCSGETLTSFNDNIGKYVCLGNLIVFLVESYDSSSDTYTFLGMEEIMDTEKALSVTEDDYGSSYYYRGDVEDNYINFADMCWRIVRIQGDGSVKLLLEDQTQVCSTTMLSDFKLADSYYGYTSDGTLDFLNPSSKVDESMVKTFYDFQSILTEEEIEKLQAGNWCIEEGITTSLKCNGTSINKFIDVTYNSTKIINAANMYVGTLTANEVIFAGATTDQKNEYFYIDPDVFINTLTKKNSTSVYSIGDWNQIYDNGSTQNNVIPSIVLKFGIKVTGDGTIDNPYVIQ